MFNLPNKQRGGVGVYPREEMHIMKDPPKSIHTRKYTQVSEGEVMSNVRTDVRGMSEPVMMFPRGVNPMRKGVNYGQSSVYSVSEKFVPPLIRQEDLLPLSRQKRDLTSVQTNIYSPYSTKISENLSNTELHLDRNTPGHYLESNRVAPTNVYHTNHNIRVSLADKLNGKIQAQTSKHQEDGLYGSRQADIHLTPKTRAGGVDTSHTNTLDTNLYPDMALVNSNIVIKPSTSIEGSRGAEMVSITNLDNRNTSHKVVDDPLRVYLPHTFNVAFYDPQSNQFRSIVLPDSLKEKIVVDTARGAPLDIYSQADSQNIKLKDYNWSIHHTVNGTSTLVLETHDRPDLFLERNNPLTYTTTASTGSHGYEHNTGVSTPTLYNNIPLTSTNTKTTGSYGYEHNKGVSTPTLYNNTPLVDVRTSSDYGYGTFMDQNREYNLPPSLSKGGFVRQGDDPGMYTTDSHIKNTHTKG